MSGRMRRDTLSIAEEAAEWLDVLEQASERDREAFVEWLQASPRHVEELLLLTALDRSCARIDLQSLQVAQEMPVHPADNIMPFQPTFSANETEPAQRPSGRKRAAYWIGAAAVLTAALAAWWPAGLLTGWQSYITDIGEQRILELDDGTLVHLNARSRLKVRLSPDNREVRLPQGEALFKVAHDPRRPFSVQAGPAVIVAVGTEFSVSHQASVTTVSVIEGRVQVCSDRPAGSADSMGPQVLSAGEHVRIQDGGAVTHANIDPAEIGLWRQRRLVFRDATLGEIAAQFNRYNRSPQIVVEDEALRQRRYGGTFDADDPEALINFLRPEPGLRLEHRGPTLLILPDER